MVVERSPTDITDEGWYWLLAKEVTGLPRIARDTYFPTHGVVRPAETTETDKPESDDPAVRRADDEALDETYLSGKWIIERPPESTPELWDGIVEDISEEHFWDGKVTTRFGREAFGEDSHAILVYTPNYFDREDVMRVRERLRVAHGVTESLFYKPDIYTSLGVYQETSGETELSDPARFTG